MTKRLLTIPLLWAAAILALPSGAQDLGIMPYGSYQSGGFDNVNLANGNVVIRIPIVSFAQKGKVHLSYSYYMNTKRWSVYEEPYTDAESWAYEGFTQVDQALNSPNGIDGLAADNWWTGGGITYTGSCEPGNIYPITNSDGSTHPFVTTKETCPGTGNMTRVSTDGTGITFVGDGGPYWGEPYATNAIYDRDGIDYIIGWQIDGAPGWAAFQIDQEGNTIVDNGYTTQDSIGRSIPDGGVPTNNLSGCTGPRTATRATTWTVPSVSGAAGIYKFCYVTINLSTQFNITPVQDASNFAVPLLQDIILPNGTTWEFEYGSPNTDASGNYGDLTKITMPTGGSVSYTYQTDGQCTTSLWENGEYYPGILLAPSRYVVSRTVDAGNGTAPAKWTYQWTHATVACAPLGQYTAPFSNVVVTDPLGNAAVHSYSDGYDPGLDGTTGLGIVSPVVVEVKVDQYTGSNTAVGATPIQTIQTDWSTSTNGGNSINGPAFPVRRTVTTAAGMVSKEEFSYDTSLVAWAELSPGSYGNVSGSYGNITAHRIYGFGTGIPGSLLRTDSTSYSAFNPSNTAYLTAYLLNLVSKTTTSDGIGNVIATTTYGYDENNGSPQGVYGNNTSKLFTGVDGSLVTGSTVFNAGGMPWEIYDGNNHLTQLTYDNSGIFVSQVNRPTTNGAQHVSYTTTDFNTGLRTSATDENGTSAGDPAHTTSYSYDVMGRQTSVSYPDGGSSRLCYTDVGGATCSQGAPPYSVVSTTAQSATANMTQTQVYDGLGQVTQAQLNSAPGGPVLVDTLYDTLGHPVSVSNPYQSKTDATYGVTTSSYDALGRPTLQLHPDGTSVQWCYDGLQDPVALQRNCSPKVSPEVGSYIDVSDERGSHWQQVSDADGQLIAVNEPDPISGIPGVETDYIYDTLGNLRNANQYGNPSAGELQRSRSFTYSSLSQLITSSNPETGTTCYGTWSGGSAGAGTCRNGYDGNGNLLYKTDATGMTVSYTYDALNRMLTKTAPDGGLTNHSFTYDQGPNGVGRLWFETDSSSAATDFSHDPMGRVTHTDWYNYAARAGQSGMNVQYDLAGNIKQIGYPDGRTVSQSWDGTGHLASVTDITSGGAATIYFGGQGTCPAGVSGGCAQYWPSGALQADTLGNGVTESLTLNTRLQPCHSSAWSSVLPSNPLGSSYGNVYDRQGFYNPVPSSPCGAQAQNSGNIWSIADNRTPGWSQSFQYDSLNRLTTGSDSLGGYSHKYIYDSFGNMVLHDNLHTPMNYWIDETPGDIPTNRLLLNTSDLQYSASGNLVSSPTGTGQSHSFLYTAENYIRCIDGCYTGSYLYNGLGERTFTMHQSFNTWNEDVYLNGQPMADVDNNGTWTDYINANGHKIAMVASQKPQWHVHGQRSPAYNNMGCGVEGAASGVGSVNGILVQAGDKFVVDVMQSGEPTYGGIGLIFQDGNGSGALTDEATGTPFYFNGVADGQWHHMVGDMSQFAGETLSWVLVGMHNNAPAGTFDLWMANAAYLQANGTIASIFHGQSVSVANFSGSACGGYNLLADTETVATAPAIATNYYVDDRLGTTQIELAGGGWPVWKGEFTPFGQEIGITQLDLGPQPADGTAMRYKFTGKERDTESGLDYFGARYYASNMARWMSPDPKAPSKKTLMNPQKWNKYNYVLNNPLSLVDPNGMEEMTIVYRTFIAPPTLTFLGRTYAGDSRSFSNAPFASSRSTITVRIETDPSIRPGNPIISQTSSAGQSRTLDANGNTTASATQTQGLPTATGTRDANGDAVIGITQDVKNPLSPALGVLTPGISANLSMNFTPDGSSVTTTGTASNFPSQELNVSGADGTTTPVFQFTPPAGSNPFSLYTQDRKVNCTTTGTGSSCQ